MKPVPEFRGPSLILVAIAHIIVFAAGLVAAALLRHGGTYVTPFAPAEQVRVFFAQDPAAARISSAFLFGSAVPFGIFTVTAVSMLRFLGVRAAGIEIANLGGQTATGSLFLSGVASWILSESEVTVSAPVVKAIAFLSFLSGGVLYAVGFGLLAAGISLTSYFLRLLPRWITGLGFLLAVTGELSWFSLIAYPANFFIPFTRFVGFVWMLLAAFALTRRIQAMRAAPTAGDSA
jgi:hypothetical protein